MKTMKYIITLCSWLPLAVACTDSHSPVEEQPQANEWHFSRTAEGSTDAFSLKMKGFKVVGSGENIDKTLKFESGSTEGTWEGGAPAWNTDATYHLLAYHPAVDGFPEDNADLDTSNENETTAWMMQYWPERTTSNRPNSFQLQHLFGQLLVHIAIEGLPAGNIPTGDIYLKTKGKVHYHNASLEPIGTPEARSLGEFEYVSSDNQWVMKEPIFIVPQTLLEKQLAIRIEVGEGTAKQVFDYTPDFKIALNHGVLTHLYLGVKYEKPNDGGNSGTPGNPNPETPAAPVIIQNLTVTVTQWDNDDSFNGTAK